MSHYREYTASVEYLWTRRMPLVVDNSAGSVVANDVAFTVPYDFEDFWKYIQSNAGEDIRVADTDGLTLLSFKLTGYVFATRTLTINIDNGVNYAATRPGICLWLYWGNATVGVPAYWGGAPAAPYSAYVLGSRLAPDVVLGWKREAVGATKPSQRLQKTPNAAIVVAIEYRSMLSKRQAPFAGSLDDEEPYGFDYSVYNSAAAAQAAMVDKTKIRADERFVYVLVQAGSDATTYTLSVLMYTTSKNTANPSRTLEMRALVEVTDLIP